MDAPRELFVEQIIGNIVGSVEVPPIGKQEFVLDFMASIQLNLSTNPRTINAFCGIFAAHKNIHSRLEKWLTLTSKFDIPVYCLVDVKQTNSDSNQQRQLHSSLSGIIIDVRIVN